jgi:hypothetical protein
LGQGHASKQNIFTINSLRDNPLLVTLVHLEKNGMQWLKQIAGAATKIKTPISLAALLVLALLVVFLRGFSQGAFDPLILTLSVVDRTQFLLVIVVALAMIFITLVALASLGFVYASTRHQLSTPKAGRKTGEMGYHLSKLRREARDAYLACRECAPLRPLDIWPYINGQTWFHAERMGSALAPIKSYFHLLEEYMALPRSRGKGPLIEEWLRTSNLESKYKIAEAAFECLLQEFGEE